MPKPTKYSPVSEAMPSMWKSKQEGRADFTKRVFPKYNPHDLNMHPIATYGACLNRKICRNHNTILGNGYCMRCWDKLSERMDNGQLRKR